MQRAILGLWGLMVFGSAACSDSGTVVGDMNGDAGAFGDLAGTGAGDAAATGGSDSGSGGKRSGTGGSREATGGSHDGGGSDTGGRSQGAGGASGGSEGDTGGTASGGERQTGGTGTGGRATGGTGGSGAGASGKTGGAGGKSEGMGGSSAGTGGGDAGAAGAAGSTACTTEACCASVELEQASLTAYLIDGQFYFDGSVELVDGPLDLYTWLATVELSSEPTGAVEGPMARSQGRDTRTYWVGSTGSSGSGLECGQTLTLQVRVRTDTTLSDSATGCAGVYGPPLTIQTTVECATCPEDAAAAADTGEVCVYPVTLECPGIITDNEGVPGAIGCPCASVLGRPRQWMCPRV
jgi:hypothetical protein